MATKKKTPKTASSETAQEMRDFAKVYNDFKNYPLIHDLFRMLYPNSDLKDKGAKQKVLQKMVERYRVFSAKHEDLHLPELILRTGKDGRIIAIPPAVQRQLAEFRIDIKKVLAAKGVIVTSAQFGAALNLDVWNSFKRYAEHLGYALVVLPIKYGAVKTVFQKELNERVLTSTFAEELKGHVLFEDLNLADDMLGLNVIRMRPTIGKFLTDRICERGGNRSQIFAAPMLELDHRPRLQHDYPKAIMTTGAVTHPNYNVDNLGQQDRTGELAAADHTYAAIIVEFSASKTFHYRQILSTTDGEFYDIDPLRGGAIYVTPKSIEHRPDDVDTAYLGDWHSGVTHPDVKEITFGQMLPVLRVKKIVLGDLFNGHSISHWDEDNASRRAFKATTGLDSLEAELDYMIQDLKWMHEKMPGAQLHVLASNHNDVLGRNIQKQRYVTDDINVGICSQIFGALYKDMKDRKPAIHEMSPIDPINWWINHNAPFVKTHGRQSLLLLPEAKNAKKIACQFHGDVGPGGARKASLVSLRKWNQWCIVGHMHSAAILGPIWRAGTCTHLMEHYINGPRTNWTHSHVIIFANGQRQILNIVNGAWHGQEKKRPRSAGVDAPTKGSRKSASKKSVRKKRASKR